MTLRLFGKIGQQHGISTHKIYNAFKALFLRKYGEEDKVTIGMEENLDRQHERSQLTGIAVSGGVDSMALAKLCSMLNQSLSAKSPSFRFHAFIVNHKAREGSKEEAIQVRSNIARLGIMIASLDRCYG